MESDPFIKFNLHHTMNLRAIHGYNLGKPSHTVACTFLKPPLNLKGVMLQTWAEFVLYKLPSLKSRRVDPTGVPRSKTPPLPPRTTIGSWT